MKLETFTHSKKQGWSVRQFPTLDSDQTLVLVFGAKFYSDSGDILGELADAYPNSHVVGCSTSGEIFDSSLSDGTLSVAVAAFEGTRVKTGSAGVQSADDPRAAGRAIARDLFAPRLRVIFGL